MRKTRLQVRFYVDSPDVVDVINDELGIYENGSLIAKVVFPKPLIGTLRHWRMGQDIVISWLLLAQMPLSLFIVVANFGGRKRNANSAT